jgi:hypothetical protein
VRIRCRLLPMALVAALVGVVLMVGTASAARTGAEFRSPSRNIGCQMEAAFVICGTTKPIQKATLTPNGRLQACRRGLRCAGDLGQGAFILRYGKSVRVGPFRCVSRKTGMSCVVIKTGKGFRISRAGITRLP